MENQSLAVRAYNLFLESDFQKGYHNSMISIRNQFIDDSFNTALSYFKNGYFKRKIIGYVVAGVSAEYKALSDKEQTSVRSELYRLACADFKAVTDPVMSQLRIERIEQVFKDAEEMVLGFIDQELQRIGRVVEAVEVSGFDCDPWDSLVWNESKAVSECFERGESVSLRHLFESGNFLAADLFLLFRDLAKIK